MINTRIITIIASGLFLFAACDPDLKSDKYARPDWLEGKVYTQLLGQPDLSTFASCVELTGYDTIIDRSGSYTIFAPNNQAFLEWFQSHAVYNGIEDIPLAELAEIVKFHIVQNPWTKIQLRSLDVYGWIDTLDLNNNKPRGFKRETLLLDKNRFYGVAPGIEKESLVIVDSLKTNWHRKVATDSRKHAPVFFKEYFSIYNINAADYEFYFDRPIENADDIYFESGRIIGDEIFAENGFVYNIDRVVEPLKSAYQILESGKDNQSYTDFLDLLNQFPEFIYNEEKTNDQPGATEGFEVDSLFDLTYPELTFDISNENTTPPSGTYGLPNDVTIRYHHGLIAPENDALNQFENDYFVGPNRWGSLKNTPENIKGILARTHMSTNPIYPSDFENGFLNGEQDVVTLDHSDIIQKEYGSNSTFIGVSNTVVPRVFKSVAAPVYLFRGYSKIMFAVEQAGLLPALKREGNNYMFFIESDFNTTLDSSLIYDRVSERFSVFMIAETSVREIGLNTNDLRTLLLNHIGVDNPKGIARKEFIENLAGNYLAIDNETGEVKGTTVTTQGYRGVEQVTVIPKLIGDDADNGKTYDIDDWFSFTAKSLFITISSDYPVFHSLLQKAGLSNDREYRYNFISESETYTVFTPTDSALNAYRADTLNIEALKEFLFLHFVQGDLIFTDGNKSPGYYETVRVDEKSTTYTTVYTKIYIYPDYDVIGFPDKAGVDYCTINESANTNILTGRTVGEGDDETFANVVNNAVIHELDKVLLFEALDTN